MARKYEIAPKWNGQTWILKACLHCGRPFSLYRDKKVYCSTACRVAAHRARKSPAR